VRSRDKMDEETFRKRMLIIGGVLVGEGVGAIILGIVLRITYG